MTQPDIEFRGPEQEPAEITDLERVLFDELTLTGMCDVCYVILTGINFVVDQPESDIDLSLLATVVTEEGTEAEVDVPFIFSADRTSAYSLLPAYRKRSDDYDGHRIEQSTAQALLKTYKDKIGEVAGRN